MLGKEKMPSRLFVPLLCAGVASAAIGFASILFGPFVWSEKAIALGMFSMGAAFVANVAGGIREKKIRQWWGGTFLTLEEGGKVLFSLNLFLSSVLAIFSFAFAYMFWFYVRAIR
jgi:hypothetical protein